MATERTPAEEAAAQNTFSPNVREDSMLWYVHETMLKLRYFERTVAKIEHDRTQEFYMAFVQAGAALAELEHEYIYSVIPAKDAAKKS